VIDDIDHDLGILPSLMARELETITYFRSLRDQAIDDRVRAFVLHIVDEEKLHVANVLRAITRLDADQARLLSAGYAAGHSTGEIPALARPARPTAAPEWSGRGTMVTAARRAAELTVGSLRSVPQES
jgi:hypothetical protein